MFFTNNSTFTNELNLTPGGDGQSGGSQGGGVGEGDGEGD